MFGRAGKLRDANRYDEALKLARDALALLRRPYIFRSRPVEASVLAGCTVLVEELAREAHGSGAEKQDLLDTVTLLRALPAESTHSDHDLTSWLPYLEARLSSTASPANGET